MDGTTTATQMIYPTIKKSDIETIAIQAVDANKTATSFELKSDGITTGGEEITVGDYEGEVEYYNLQGQRVLNPSNGIYIERRGSKTTKRYIR